MEAANDLFAVEFAKFHQLKSAIDKLVYSNSDSYRTELQRIIDQLDNITWHAYNTFNQFFS